MSAAETATTVHFLDEMFAHAPLARVGFRFWDGTSWPPTQPRAATLVLKHPGALREMFGAGTEKALAEAFLNDVFDIEGDIEAALELADAINQPRDASWMERLRTFYQWQALPESSNGHALRRAVLARTQSKHSIERDRDAVSFHYDLSNGFYQLWLDARMLYSCAYFEHPGLSLDAAQEAKLRHLCRKLRLRPGQRLLDIGCGWGGLAIYAAQRHDVQVTGITLSREQAGLARERVRAAGLAGRITIELRDYRDLTETESFDAIVSVGMSEHVGAAQLARYFEIGRSLLRPGGVFLNHAIGDGVRPRHRAGPSFIDEYVFPDTELPPIPAVLQAAESAGLEVRDVENLREHYATTLRHWVRRLEAAHDEALRFVNEATYRVWRLYMAGSAQSFARNHLAIYQALLSKPDAQGHAHLPPTRDDWYREA